MESMNVLLIEDEKITRISLANNIRKAGYDVHTADDGEQGLALCKKQPYDVVITDLRLPKINGMEIVKYVKEHHPNCEVIVITAHATVNTAVEAIKLGAYDYVTKPFSPEKIIGMLGKIAQFQSIIDENKSLKEKLEAYEHKNIIGKSPEMRNLLKTIHTIATHEYTVLIQGESGTGKEVVARAIHDYSDRRNKPFIAINCAAIPEPLLESELFGHEKGSFSGAIQRHLGHFERASGGTFFIDDIDDLPEPLQVKLLRVLQERELFRVGGSEIIKVDVRIICATKVRLKDQVDKGLFRGDLYYRLNIIPLIIPPLRHRLEDIPDLVEHFLSQRNSRDKLEYFTKNVYKKFLNYHWPGNVRELENIVERVIALSDINKSADLLFDGASDDIEVNQPYEDDFPGLKEFITQKENEVIQWALKLSKYNISKAAQLLRVPRSTLRSKLEKHELEQLVE